MPGNDGMKGEIGPKGEQGFKGTRGPRGEEGPLGPKVFNFFSGDSTKLIIEASTCSMIEFIMNVYFTLIYRVV